MRTLLIAQRAAALAKAEGEAKLAAWQATPASAALGAPLTLSRLDAQSQPQALVEAALRADATRLPALVGVDLGSEGYAVVRVVKDVARVAPTPDGAKQENAQFVQVVTAAENLAYYELLKERFKAQILVPQPAEASAR